MKIALLYHQIPPFISGTGSYTWNLGKNLSKNGVEVIIITGHYKKDQIEVINKNLKIFRLKTPNITPRFFWFQVINKKKILNILEKEKVDIAHFQETASAFIINSNLDSKKILTMHGTAKRVFKEAKKIPIKYWSFRDILIHIIGFPLYYLLEKKEINNAEYIIALNKPHQESIKKEFKTNKKIFIIHQPINIEEINKIKVRKDKQRFIIFGGRLIYIKGITFLLEAFKLVRKECPELKLKIYGAGPLFKKIKGEVIKNRLEKSVFINGAVSNIKLLKEIKNSLFLVQPSLIEAESVSMLEALASKKPIIAFDLPFIQDTLHNNKDSLLVKKDSNELAKAIIRLYKDNTLRKKLSKGAYETAKQHDWNKIIDKYLAVYRRVL